MCDSPSEDKELKNNEILSNGNDNLENNCKTVQESTTSCELEAKIQTPHKLLTDIPTDLENNSCELEPKLQMASELLNVIPSSSSSVTAEKIESSTLEKVENKTDLYAYIDRNGFTSEKFKIEIRGLPKYYGIAELRKLLNKKLKLNSSKIKPPHQDRGRSNWLYVCFQSEEDRQNALKAINGMKWKNCTLSASEANPAPDPYVKRRMEASEESNKRQKAEDNRTQEEKLKDSAIPLWRMPLEEQSLQKTNNLNKILKKMVFDIEKQNANLKPFFYTQRTKNEGVPFKMFPLVESEVVNGYRNKCEFAIGINEETGEKVVGMRLGSYATGNIGVGPIYNLPHIPDSMKQAVKVFEEFVKSSPLDVFNPEQYSGHWRQLTVRVGMNTGQLMLVVGVHPQKWNQEEKESFKQTLKVQLVERFRTGGEGMPELTSLYYQEITKRASGEGIPTELVWGKQHIVEQLCGLTFNISPQSFFQINTKTAELLYKAVGQLATLTPQTTLVDVCCGIGSIGLCLAKDCGEVLGLEVVEQAVADARQNALANNIHNCNFYCGPAEEILQSVVDKAKFEDVIAVVDPPRAGLRQNAVVMLRRTSKVKKIAYLACELKFASRNICDLAKPTSKTMLGDPFVPVAVMPVDMFPYTERCEVIILLERLKTE